ncbi:MAG: aldo/keto reductase [Phycisphaerales bacterium]|nr:aldo/keto reductase [Phycisphaerales bacterium]
MERRPLGRTGLMVSPLGFGGSEIGFQGVTQDTVTRLLNAALDAGLNCIDTAAGYATSEEMIGVAIGARRSDFVLLTKCGWENGFGQEDWSAASLERCIDRSLGRLRTDCVDVMQLHSCGVEHLERGEVIAVLERAKRAGKTRFIGYSGDDAAALWAVRSGRFDTLQTSLSIADQQSIDLTLPLARERGMGVIVKRPIANAAWRDAAEPVGKYHHGYWKRLRELGYPFLKDWERSGDTASATALRFTLSQPGVSTAIVGTTKPERWAANAALLRAGPLPEAEVRAIRERWKAVAKADWVGQV